ncbi:MAG: hypothetical protein LBI35_07225 [Burkholderiales bacterium]|jgi:hypothetical protein|nr:hypothetical protein [Burkholderiales bacterium]
MSKVIAILDAAFAAIKVPAIAGVSVHRQRTFAVPSSAETATINVKLGRKSPPILKTGPNTKSGVADRVTELLVVITAHGDSALEEVERLSGEVVKRLFADTTLGGACLDIEEFGAERNEADTDGTLQMLTPVFHVKYRTTGDES